MSKEQTNEVARFEVSLSAKNIKGFTNLDMVLARPDLTDSEISVIAEANGFTVRHPNYGSVKRQISRTFSMSEIIRILVELQAMGVEVSAVRVNPPSFHTDSPEPGKVIIFPRYEKLDITALGENALPFQLLGLHSPTNIALIHS